MWKEDWEGKEDCQACQSPGRQDNVGRVEGVSGRIRDGTAMRGDVMSGGRPVAAGWCRVGRRTCGTVWSIGTAGSARGTWGRCGRTVAEEVLEACSTNEGDGRGHGICNRRFFKRLEGRKKIVGTPHWGPSEGGGLVVTAVTPMGS